MRSEPSTPQSVYLNGRMVAYDEAKIGHDDAGLQHGVGLFETMAAVGGRVFRAAEHLQRLAASARDLGLAATVDVPRLTEALQQALDHNGLANARIRLTLTPGRINLLTAAEDDPPGPTILIVATPPTAYDAALFERGVRVTVVPSAANPFDATAGHKTVAYWHRLMSLRQATAAGADEALWLSTSNHLASGAISNVFLVRDEQLLTPIARGDQQVTGALPAPVLPGVTRAAVIGLADEMGLDTSRQMLDINDILEADEIFLTNSSWQILPVSAVEKKQIGSGAAGKITKQLRERLLETIDAETTAV